MPLIENVTANRGYELPGYDPPLPANPLSVDVQRIIAAIEAIDADVAANIAALAA